MKKLLLLTLIPLLFTSCSVDRYEGDERIIVEGNVLYNNTPLNNAEVNVYPVYNKPANGSIAEIEESNVRFDSHSSISQSFTDNSGKLSLSIPRNEETDVYIVKISRGYDSRYYGYISRYNARKYYINLGTLNF